jgi:hypothetical protein
MTSSHAFAAPFILASTAILRALLSPRPHVCRLPKREQLKRVWEVGPESQGHSLASTVLYVPYSLDSGWGMSTTKTLLQEIPSSLRLIVPRPPKSKCQSQAQCSFAPNPVIFLGPGRQIPLPGKVFLCAEPCFPLRNPDICIFFRGQAQTGNCQFSGQCSFAHGRQELRNPSGSRAVTRSYMFVLCCRHNCFMLLSLKLSDGIADAPCGFMLTMKLLQRHRASVDSPDKPLRVFVSLDTSRGKNCLLAMQFEPSAGIGVSAKFGDLFWACSRQPTNGKCPRVW